MKMKRDSDSSNAYRIFYRSQAPPWSFLLSFETEIKKRELPKVASRWREALRGFKGENEMECTGWYQGARVESASFQTDLFSSSSSLLFFPFSSFFFLKKRNASERFLVEISNGVSLNEQQIVQTTEAYSERRDFKWVANFCCPASKLNLMQISCQTQQSFPHPYNTLLWLHSKSDQIRSDYDHGVPLWLVLLSVNYFEHAPAEKQRSCYIVARRLLLLLLCFLRGK